MIKIKICGITNLDDALSAEKKGADALGFIFYKKSPRYINPKKAKEIIKRLSPFITTVGVFVNDKECKVKRIAHFCNLDVLQFHGDESPAYCTKFKQYKIIKAFRIKNRLDFKNIRRYNTDAILLDTFSKGRFGGTGKTFDWRKVKNLRWKNPLILSGGLTVKNARRAIKLIKIYAVDVSSGVEKSVGRKDHRKLDDFISRVVLAQREFKAS